MTCTATANHHGLTVTCQVTEPHTDHEWWGTGPNVLAGVIWGTGA